MTKTNKEVAKTGKEAGKAIDTLLGETKKEKSHTTEVRLLGIIINRDRYVVVELFVQWWQQGRLRCRQA